MSEAQKAIGWYEVYSADKAKLVDFYTSVFGYETTDMDMGEMGIYTMFISGGHPFCGTMEMKGEEWEGIPPHWMTYFTVDEIGAGMDSVKSAGGEVMHGPIPIPNDGQIAVCKDDQGAVFSIVAEGKGDDQQMPPIQAIDWVELMVPDREKANAYYQKAFGWNLLEQDMGPEVGMYSMFGVGEQFHAGAMKVDPNMAPPNWLPYLVTKDINGTVEKIKANGGQVHMGPMSIPEVGEIAMCQDSTGAAFGLHQPASR